MFHIAICDDEPIIAKKIEKLVTGIMNKLGEDFEINVEFSGKKILSQMKEEPANLLLLDIDMPEITGIDIASELYDQNLNDNIIFITSHANLVFDTLKYHPFQFVRKDKLEEELFPVLENYLSIYHRDNKVIEIVNDKGNHLIELNSILYVEKVDRRMSIICKNGKSFHTWSSLKNFEKQYTRNGFCRIHNSILVNMKYVSEIDNDIIIMDNEEKLPLSRSRKKSVKQRYIEFMRKI